MGATALFGEKYGDIVRVVKMGDVSVEFCGGTHLDNTAKVGAFIITSEGSVASGVRRIEAITGKRVNDRMNELADTIAKVAEHLKASPADILAKTDANIAELRKTHQSIEKLKEQLMAGQTDRMLFGAKSVCGLNVLTITNGPVTAEDIRKLGDKLRDANPKIVAVLAATDESKGTLLAVCGKEAVAKGIKAGELIKAVTAKCEGSGGGKPESAMGGCKNLLKLDDALAIVDDFVHEHVKE